MATLSSPSPANGFVTFLRRIYSPLGFSTGYNFILWLITMGTLLGFSLARSVYLSFYGVFCSPSRPGGNGAAPGECYYYLRNPWRTGMQLHLYTIIPATILVCFQFTPWVRYKMLLIHRLNGYLVILLSLASSVGILIIAQVAFGGDFSTKVFAGTSVIATTTCYIMAYVHIKLLQIDQHRAWMIRCWALFSTIITVRIIMIVSAVIMSSLGGFFTLRPCAQINFVFGQHNTLQLYPICQNFYDGTNPSQHAIVEAKFPSDDPNQIAAALGIPFGAAGWLSLVIHAVTAELYLRLTPAETNRLRQVSYERQRKAGFTRPGYTDRSGAQHIDLHDAQSTFATNKLPDPSQKELV